MKNELNKLIRLLTVSSTLLGRAVWLIVAVIILVAAGHLAFKHQTPNRPLQTQAPVPVPQTDWQGVDRSVEEALKAAHRAAETAAQSKLDAWSATLMGRVDADFLPWYFGYWNQQALGLRSAFYWTTHALGISQSDAGERITWEIQQQFAQRVMRPEIAQMELERMAQETLQVYVDELNPKLAAIPKDYKIPQGEWLRYLNEIAVLTSQVEGNRQVSITLKTVAATTAGGGLILARAMAPEIKTLGARVTGKMTGTAAGELAVRTGGKMAARVGGEALGEIIGLVVIILDVADHYRTKRTELPILRKNILEYFGEVKKSLLHDPEHGVITALDKIETTIVATLRQREAARL
jgi:hypothetical protein